LRGIPLKIQGFLLPPFLLPGDSRQPWLVAESFQSLFLSPWPLPLCLCPLLGSWSLDVLTLYNTSYHICKTISKVPGECGLGFCLSGKPRATWCQQNSSLHVKRQEQGPGTYMALTAQPQRSVAWMELSLRCPLLEAGRPQQRPLWDSAVCLPQRFMALLANSHLLRQNPKAGSSWCA
jgi:hypothetical protein